MNTFSLNVTSLPPFSGNKPESAIIMCHGFGGDGKDISFLGQGWRRHLPSSIFLCPDAPDVCSINPSGYQWFDLSNNQEDVLLAKSLVAEKKLSFFIEEIKKEYQLPSEKIALVGFSQGCMISIQTAMKLKEKIACLIGYSGKIINKKNIIENISSRPKIFLMHGDHDTIVPASHLLEAKEFFLQQNIKIKVKLFKNCEHKIPVEGSSLGLDFLRKNLS